MYFSAENICKHYFVNKMRQKNGRYTNYKIPNIDEFNKKFKFERQKCMICEKFCDSDYQGSFNLVVTEKMIADINEGDLNQWIKNIFGQFAKRSPKSHLFLYKIAESKVHPTAPSLTISSKAATMNDLIEDTCPNHGLSQDPPLSVNQSNYQAKVQSTCYCSKAREAGNFEKLEEIQKKHLKASKNFYIGFRFTAHPFGISA